MANLAGIVRQLRKERGQAARTIERLDAALAALKGKASYGRAAGIRRKISAAGKARIAAAQRARWTKAKGHALKPKRTMSASARRKIAASQRARWAKLKAQRKK